MCSRQNSLGKGGLNERYGLCKSSINRYVSFLPSDDTEIFISRNVKAKRREFIECDIRNAYQNAADILDILPITELNVEEELGVLKDTPDGEAYYRNGYCTKCKAQMPTEVLHGKISQRSIKFCFNCGAKINGSLWTLIEEGIIKEK